MCGTTLSASELVEQRLTKHCGSEGSPRVNRAEQGLVAKKETDDARAN